MSDKEVHEQTLLSLFAPVRCFLDDPAVSEIMINGPDQIYIERNGCLELADASFASVEALTEALRNLSRFLGKTADDQHPILEGRLPDGSRVEAVLPPASPDGPTVSIRRFFREALSIDRLVGLDALTPLAAQTLSALVRGKVNIIISGGTGSGKTSMLNALTGLVPEGERVMVIEDARELQPRRSHLVQLQTRPPDADGGGAITARDLFRATLRMRPDRVVVGEIRGAEALEMIQAILSGHAGCMATVYATHPRETLRRLEGMAVIGDLGLHVPAVRVQVAAAVQVIVQVARLQDGARKITHITEVAGYDLDKQEYRMQDLFVRDHFGVDAQNRIVSTLRPCGVLPQFASQLAEQGLPLPAAFLAEAGAVPEASDSLPPPRTAVAPVFIGDWADRHRAHGHSETAEGWPAAE